MCTLDDLPSSDDPKLRTSLEEDVPDGFFCSTNRFGHFEFMNVYCRRVRFFVVSYAPSENLLSLS